MLTCTGFPDIVILEISAFFLLFMAFITVKMSVPEAVQEKSFVAQLAVPDYLVKFWFFI